MRRLSQTLRLCQLNGICSRASQASEGACALNFRLSFPPWCKIAAQHFDFAAVEADIAQSVIAHPVEMPRDGAVPTVLFQRPPVSEEWARQPVAQRQACRRRLGPWREIRNASINIQYHCQIL